MQIKDIWTAILAAAFLVSMPATASLIVLSGNLDASQVIAPVYQTDSNGDFVLDQYGQQIVIGSTPFRADGITPVSTSTATGFATVTVDTMAYTITTDFHWTGLSGVADRAHLHDAPAGASRLAPPNDNFFHEVITCQKDMNGDCLVDAQGNEISVVAGGYVDCGPFFGFGLYCAPATGSLLDVLQLAGPDDGYGFADFNTLLSTFMANGVFLDIHTELYPGGEIRGQLLYVPEPATLALFGLGLAGLGFSRRKKA